MIFHKCITFFLCIFIFFICWILFAFNYWNGDRDAYEVYYARESLLSWGIEIGYGASNIIANNFGLSFQSFQVITSLFILGFYYNFFKNFSIFPLFSLLLFTLVFFPLDYVLLRNFIAFSIVLLCFSSLQNWRYGRFTYFFGVLIASLFHQSSLFFLPFTFIRLTRNYSFIEIFTFILIVVISFFLINKMIVWPTAVQHHFDIYPVSMPSAILKSVVHSFFSTLVCSLALYAIRIFHAKYPDCNNWFLRQSFLIFNLNVLSLFFIILYFESEIFVRLLRCILFFNIFYLLNFLLLVPRRSFRILAFLAILIMCFFIVMYFIYPVMNFTVYPLFENNIIFEGRF